VFGALLVAVVGAVSAIGSSTPVTFITVLVMQDTCFKRGQYGGSGARDKVLLREERSR
jgi:hypothetical protein